MSTPPQVPAGGGKGPGKGAGKLVAGAGGKRNLMIGGAVLTALVAFLVSRGGNGGGGGGGSDQVMMGYDSTPYDMYDDLQGQLEDIQRQIDSGEVTPGTPTTPRPTPTSPKPKPIPSKPKPTVPAKPGPSKYVTIKRGDTLSGIAKKNKISMAALKKLNPVFWTNKKYKNGNLIWSGGKVRVK